MARNSTVERADGRRRAWTAPNGAAVVLPVEVRYWETDDLTGEITGSLTARVELVDGCPQLVKIAFEAPEGAIEPRLQGDFRWSSPREIVEIWMADVIAAGSDPLTEPVPIQFWAPPGRQDLTPGFLEEIAEQYHELGYGYANILARKYATTPRTVRSWVDRAKKIGIITRKTK